MCGSIKYQICQNDVKKGNDCSQLIKIFSIDPTSPPPTTTRKKGLSGRWIPSKRLFNPSEAGCPRGCMVNMGSTKPFIPLHCSPRRTLGSSPPLLASSDRGSRQETLPGRWKSPNPCQASGRYAPRRGKKHETNAPLAFRWAERLGSSSRYIPGNWTTRMQAPPFMLCYNFMNEPRLYHRRGGKGGSDRQQHGLTFRGEMDFLIVILQISIMC